MALIHLDGGSAPSVIVDGAIVRDVLLGGEAPPSARRLDCVGNAIRLGEVNAHTHLYSGLAPFGMPPPEVAPENFVQILERVWWRLDRALDAESLRAAARHYLAQALLFGTTTVIDHHESPTFLQGSLDVLADAADELGCRLITCYGATDRNGGREEGEAGLEECHRFVRRNQRPLVMGVVGLHASFTVSDATVMHAGELARELSVPVHVHVAEDGADVADARRRGARGPLERLKALGALPRGSIVAHGVCLTPEQVRQADADGLWLVHNPRSNAGNKVGRAESLSASRHVALGTDGYPADMREERASVVVPVDPESSRHLAAEVWGVRFSLGPNSAADLVVWREADDAERPGARPRHVVVGGRVVVEDGRLLTGDYDAIRADAERQAERLWARMKDVG